MTQAINRPAYLIERVIYLNGYPCTFVITQSLPQNSWAVDNA